MKVHRITRLVVVGLAAGAIAAPVASARPAPLESGAAATEPESPPVVQSVDEGLDLGSAAIGAGVAGGLILLVSAGGIGFRHRHEHLGTAR
jgi:hypothetical protein